MTTQLPLWVDLVAAALVVLAGLLALVGSFGLARLDDFYQRVHAPTLGATGGTWALSLASALQFSLLRETLFVHALLIPIFVAITAPVTTVFLMRAALFRHRLEGRPVPAPVTPRGGAATTPSGPA
ncbi:MAG: monovalent cation/H(+) antiporter subunit G [Myxococcota bacterium]|nr:monovalent cation/H(+) antiporter subunit G [Myxococcota bacterium]